MNKKTRKQVNRGIDIALELVKDEMERPNFYSFKMSYHPQVGLPYPREHDMIEVRLTYTDIHKAERNAPFDYEYIKHFQEDYRFLRDRKSIKWFKCEDFKKVGEPVK